MATLPIKSILQQTEYSQHHGLLGRAAAGATFKLGNLISVDANGEFVETAVGAGAASAKNKLAAHDSGRAERKQDYVDSTGTMVFEVTATGAVSTADLLEAGKTYGLGRDATTGFHTLLLTDTANAVWRLVAVNGSTLVRGAIGDTNVGVYAQLVAR
jgi:hypothetical protein